VRPPEVVLEELAILVSAECKRRGLSRRAAGRELGVGASTIHRVISGDGMDVKTFLTLIQWLGIGPDWFATTAVPDAYHRGWNDCSAAIHHAIGAVPNVTCTSASTHSPTGSPPTRPEDRPMTEPTQPPQLILTLVDDTFQQPARIQAHCHGHDPKQLLGQWDAPDDEASEAGYVAALQAAAERHLREAHPEVSTDV